MSDNMNIDRLINIEKFVKNLEGERFKNFIVHSGPLSGKSDYARCLADKTGGKYLNLLDRFAKDEDLKSKIDVFDKDSLEKLLIEESKETKVLILDNMEFLINTWNGDGYNKLFYLLFRTWDSFKPFYKTILGVFLITDTKILNLDNKTSKGESLILPLSRLESIGGY
jgi:hypothetical protein